MIRKPWLVIEEKFIKDNFSKLKSKEIAKELNRSYSSVLFHIAEMKRKGLISGRKRVIGR